MINYLKDILFGKIAMTDHMRYELARVGVGAVHIVLLFLFFYIGCIPLAIFNCFSVLFYAVIAEILIRKENYLMTFIITYLEIVIHSFFACIMVGWSFGFSLYNIGLLYVAYYFSYTSHSLRRKILTPTILGIINLALTLTMRLFSYTHGPVYTDYSNVFALYVSTMNILVAAIMIMFFATLHTIEIRRKEYELRTINSELDKLARFDALTTLRNRHSIEEEFLSKLHNTSDDYCFIMSDIDDFKQFNDRYGHACGDFVLKLVANIILKNIGPKHIACRWGGEEILILLKANMDYAHTIAEKIRYEIEQMNAQYNDIPIHITMTFGIAPYAPEQSFEKCISAADKHLYDGKQKGKNCVIGS